jgi:hypothetical protein
MLATRPNKAAARARRRSRSDSREIRASRSPARYESRGRSARKVQIALWARSYEADKAGYVTVSIGDLLDDLGYVRKKRAHKPANKIAISLASLRHSASCESPG